jgi:hypothetical protein
MTPPPRPNSESMATVSPARLANSTKVLSVLRNI